MSDSDSKKPQGGETVVGLPEVSTGETVVGLDALAEPTTNPAFAPAAVAATNPALEPAPPDVTAPSLAPVPAAAEGPTTIGAPPARRPSRLAVPAQPAPAAPQRRPSRVAVPIPSVEPSASLEDDVHGVKTDPRRIARAPDSPPADSRFELTPGLVAAVAGGIAALGIATWIFWPAERPPAPPPPAPIALPEAPTAQPKVPEPRPAPVAEPPPATPPVPTHPVLTLDARTHVIDPFGLHAPDLPLDPGHKYRLRIERDDSRLGTVLARLDEAKGWGVVRKMASHAALQFGGAKALRLHCEPGRGFTDADTFPLDLVDLATKKPIEFQVFPAKHCWDVEVMRTLDLGDGVRHRVRVPTDAKPTLGEKVPLRVAWVLESADEPRKWRTGLLNPGESVLVEGRRARFAILDPYAGDNEGRLDLELLSPDTESSGLVTPSSASGAKFVPLTPEAPK